MQAAKKISDIELLKDECAKARKLFEAAEINYLLFLRNVEETRASVWRVAHATFIDFLEKCVGVPGPARYANFTECYEKLGAEKLRKLGLDMCRELLKARDVNRGKLERAAVAWSNEHGGVHPSSEYAKTMRQQVDPVEVVPSPVRRLDELEKLRAESVELKRENARLTKENKRLSERLAKLEGPKTPNR